METTDRPLPQGFSLRPFSARPEFDLLSVNVGFVYNKLQRERFPFQGLRLPLVTIISSMLHALSFIYHRLYKILATESVIR
jgi:hypothetical protein